jgi:hypothetical protein
MCNSFTPRQVAEECPCRFDPTRIDNSWRESAVTRVALPVVASTASLYAGVEAGLLLNPGALVGVTVGAGVGVWAAARLVREVAGELWLRASTRPAPRRAVRRAALAQLGTARVLAVEAAPVVRADAVVLGIRREGVRR